MDTSNFSPEIFFIQFGGVILFLTLLVYIVNSVAFAMFFNKVGEKPWKGFVPVLNTWVFFKLGGQNPLWSLLVLATFIPVIGYFGVVVAAVYASIAAYRIGLAFGKEGWWVILYIFAPLVWLILLAFDKTSYNPVLAGISSPDRSV